MPIVIETIFDLAYLALTLTLGFIMIKRNGGKTGRLFGVMALILGGGDSLYLVSRLYGLWSGGTEAHSVLTGVGIIVATITMAVFYVLLFHLWMLHYHDKEFSKKAVLPVLNLGCAVYLLALFRITLCLFTHHRWFSGGFSQRWGIYRNIPALVLELLLALVFLVGTLLHWDRQNDAAGTALKDPLRFVGPALGLSFIFYVPVVFWASSGPLTGILMALKTLVFVWILLMGWRAQNLYAQKVRTGGETEATSASLS